MSATTIDEQRAALLERGYVEVPSHGAIHPGVRVCHRGQQWWEARRDGTATVVAVFHKADSPWSRSWHMADVEVICQADKDEPGTCHTSWAQYHIDLASKQPSEVAS